MAIFLIVSGFYIATDHSFLENAVTVFEQVFESFIGVDLIKLGEKVVLGNFVKVVGKLLYFSLVIFNIF